LTDDVAIAPRSGSRIRPTGRASRACKLIHVNARRARLRQNGGTISGRSEAIWKKPV